MCFHGEIWEIIPKLSHTHLIRPIRYLFFVKNAIDNFIECVVGTKIVKMKGNIFINKGFAIR